MSLILSKVSGLFSRSDGKLYTRSNKRGNIDKILNIFVEFGEMKAKEPEHAEVQAQVKKLQDYISDHFYKCSNEVLKGLGYKEKEFKTIIPKVDNNLSIEEQVKEALKLLLK